MAGEEYLPRRWSKLKDTSLQGLQRQMNSFFDNFFEGFEPFSGIQEKFVGFTPKLNLTEDEKELRVTVELPGLEEKDVEISLTRDVLTIRGEKKIEHEEKEKNSHYVERTYGSFERKIPVNLALIDQDNVDASLKNGILIVKMPKSKQAQSEVKKVSVRAAK